MKNIKIDFEGRNKDCAFFALYAGLRMYSDFKAKQKEGTNEVSIAGAEAYCILQDLKESHPNEWEEAKKEYDDKLKNLFISGVSKSFYCYDYEALGRNGCNKQCKKCEYESKG
ncbi:MAG: hypothetical protein ACPGRW_05990 [Flavobacteriaceae bacterium]